MKTNFYVSYLAMSDNDNLEGVQDLLVIFPEMSGDVFGRLHPLVNTTTRVKHTP